MLVRLTRDSSHRPRASATNGPFECGRRPVATRSGMDVKGICDGCHHLRCGGGRTTHSGCSAQLSVPEQAWVRRCSAGRPRWWSVLRVLGVLSKPLNGPFAGHASQKCTWRAWGMREGSLGYGRGAERRREWRKTDPLACGTYHPGSPTAATEPPASSLCAPRMCTYTPGHSPPSRLRTGT